MSKHNIAEKVTLFKENGYVLIEPLDGDLIDKCKNLKRQIIESKDKMRTAFANEEGVARHLINIARSESKELVMEVLKDKNVYEIINSAFDNIDLDITHSKISFKTVGANSDWLAHQDNGYRIANGKKAREGSAIMVFLEDVTLEDGPLEVISKSHKNGTLEHERIWESDEKIDYQLGLTGFLDDEFTKVTGKAGSVVLFDNDTIHRSGPSYKSSRYCMIVEVKGSDHKSLDDYGLPPIPYNYSPSLLESLSKNVKSYFDLGRVWMIIRKSKLLTKVVRRIAFR